MESRDLFRKEGDGKGYYERCGAEAGVAALSQIFAMFSEDEGRHAEALHALQSGARVDLAQSNTVDGARCLLRYLSVQDAALAQFNGDLAAFGCAMDFEAASVRFYGRLAREAVPGLEKELFLKIAAEDEVHFTLLEHMRELLEPAHRKDGRKEGGPDAH